MKLETFEKLAEESYEGFLGSIHDLNEDPVSRTSPEEALRSLFPHLNPRRPILKMIVDLSDPEEYPDREVHLYLEFNRETDEVAKARYVYRDGEHRKEFPVYRTGELDILARYVMAKE